MKQNWKQALRFALYWLPAGLAAGFFTTRSLLPSLPPEQLSQLGGETGYTVIGMVQIGLYALLAGFIGFLLSQRLGLMRPLRLERRRLLSGILWGAACGVILSLDKWTFARWIPALRGSYESASRFDLVSWLTAVLYGGVVEELLLRLLVMSLIAFLGWKLFFRSHTRVPICVLIAANVLSAMLFAAGHLPATQLQFGQLTPLLLLRCFLMNGAFGLVFGSLYRRHGIQYAMIAHALAHIVSRTIWLL